MLPASPMFSGGGAGETLLLDLYPSAFAAFSMFKLRSDYEGPCLQISRNDAVLSDRTNISFDENGYIDISAIAAWPTATRGAPIISIWYNQSGNNNLVAATGNYIFISTDVTENGVICARLDGATPAWVFNTAFAMPSEYDWFITSRNRNTSANAGAGIIINNTISTSGQSVGVACTRLGQNINLETTGRATSNNDTKNFSLFSFAKEGSSRLIRVNGVDESLTNTTQAAAITQVNSVGRYRAFGQSTFSSANTTSIVLYNSSQGANRSDIENYLMTQNGIAS